MKLRLLVGLVTGLVAVGGVALATLPPGGTFIDDDGHIFEPSIEAVAAAEITKGCNPPTNDRFCPDDFVSRGQMAAFIARALSLPGTNLDFFVDDESSVFEPAINKMAFANITKGCNPPTNTLFCPDDSVSRGQMAAFLVRAFGYSDDGGGDLFIDDDSSVFEAAIDKLATAGVTKGCNPPINDRFCPDDLVTRGQMAGFLRRALGLDPIVPPPPSSTTSTTIDTTTSSTIPPNPGDTKNCSDFDTWAEAQAWFDFYFPYYGDVANLDADNDGIACESLPGAP